SPAVRAQLIAPIFLSEQYPQVTSIESPELGDTQRAIDPDPVERAARDLDLDRKVRRWIDLKIDVVGIFDPLQVAEIEALIRLESLVHVLAIPGRGAHGHHRNVQLPGEDPHDLTKKGLFPFVLGQR